MADDLAAQIEQLRTAIASLEAQRPMLGDAVADASLGALRDKIAALQAQASAQTLPHPADERRLITILFTDIVGSTQIAEQLDPEEWRQTVAHLHETVGGIVTRHHGAVAQYLGDGLLAFFGAQDSGEQDAENAVRAALDIQSAVGVAHTFPLREPLRLRVGIHSGLVLIGELGADAHKELTATGDAMNLAARLQAAAPPGGILISHETYRSVRGVFELTPQPLLTVKGKREPIQTYLVRRAKARIFHATARGVVGAQTSTIGRQAEIQQLQSAYLEAYDTKRVVWVQLVGEPGVGKSRLMRDMADWIELRPETVGLLRGRAFASEQNQPFALVRRMWFDRFQIADDTPRAQAEARWVERFREFTGIQDEEAAHALGLLVGLTFGGSPHIGAMRDNPAQVKGRAFVVSREALRAARAQLPLHLMLEDLHFADESSIEYLREVVWQDDWGQTTDDDGRLQGMFVLSTTRPEWGNSPAGQFMVVPTPAAIAPDADELAPTRANFAVHAITLQLAPLTDTATRELAEELLREVEQVPDQVVQMIVERSEGIPYFAEEMVNYFHDRGMIDKSVEPWRFVPQRMRQAPLPETLQHLLLSRLSGLADTERGALQRGAVFGRNFWTGGIQHLGAGANDAVLGSLQPRGFIEPQPESALEGESEWSFHHALLREVTYESILKRERSALHKKAAEWLEQQARNADRLDEFAGLLGEHAEQAGDLDAAAEWFLQAGERAAAQGATLQARAFFDRALALLPPVAREQRWRALLGSELALRTMGEWEARQATMQALLTVTEELLDDDKRAEAWLRAAMGVYAQTKIHDADQAIAAAERAGNKGIALHARAIKAIALGRLGDSQAAQELAEQVIVQARELRDAPSLYTPLGVAAVAIGEAGDLARSVNLNLESAEAAQQSGDRFFHAVVLGNVGAVYALLGMYKQARATLELALTANQAIGARHSQLYNLQNLGLVTFRLGDGRAARQFLEESIREFAVMSDDFARAASLEYLALELEREGDLAGAARRYQEVAAVMERLGSRAAAHDALAGVARCALGQGQLDEARQVATELWQYLLAHDTAGMEYPVWAYLTCADIFDALGATQESRAAAKAGYRELMTRAEKISNPEWRKSFLENVAEHRAMSELWERVSGTPR